MGKSIHDFSLVNKADKHRHSCCTPFIPLSELQVFRLWRFCRWWRPTKRSAQPGGIIYHEDASFFLDRLIENQLLGHPSHCGLSSSNHVSIYPLFLVVAVTPQDTYVCLKSFGTLESYPFYLIAQRPVSYVSREGTDRYLESGFSNASSAFFLPCDERYGVQHPEQGRLRERHDGISHTPPRTH